MINNFAIPFNDMLQFGIFSNYPIIYKRHVTMDQIINDIYTIFTILISYFNYLIKLNNYVN